jgi:microcompartment protein CcmL/EutN
MKKSYKITCIVLIALNAILVIVGIAVGAYQAAVTSFLAAFASFLFYKYSEIIFKAHADIDNLIEEINRYSKALTECEERERIAKQELAKMRKRLQVTEAARKELEEAYHNELQKNAQRATGVKHPSKV